MDSAGFDARSSEIQTIVEMPRYFARHSPDVIALSFEGRETSYRALDVLSSRVANGLIAMDVRPAARIATLDRNTDVYFEVLLGAAKARIVTIPLNARLAPPEIAFAINDARAEILFIGETFVKMISDIRDQLTTVRRVIVFSEEYAAWRDAYSDDDPQLPLSADEVCLQMYTSGTTGYPKGVQLTHRNLALHGRDRWKSFSSKDIMLSAIPLFHIAGCGMCVYGLMTGMKVVVVPEFVPANVLSIIQSQRTTVSFLVPAMLLAMLAEPSFETFDVSSLRHIIYGASPIPAALLKRALLAFKNADFFQVYGLTETGGVITYLPPEAHVSGDSELLKSCGQPSLGVDLKVVDAQGQTLAPRRIGEVVCRTSQNTPGYWRRPDDTANVLRDGWFYTGDAGFLDENGYLYIHDRLKDMIVSGGENVYPAEIESALSGHADIADLAVIGVPDEKWGETVKAVIVLKPGRSPDPSGILLFARERLAGFKVPRSIDFVDSLPRNPSGKILKRTLREQYWKGYERQVN